MEQNFLQKERSKSNVRGRPSKNTLLPLIHSCINITWTVLLVWLSLILFTNSGGSPLADVYHHRFRQDEVLSIPDDGSFLASTSKHEILRNTVKTMNGRLRDNSSVYRQPPSAMVDKAWNEAEHAGTELFNVTANDLLQAGLDPAVLIAWDEVDDAFPVSFEYTHLIHCLNAVRKEMWHEHYFPPTIENDPELIQMRQAHAMHCLHIVLQDIMCHAEINLIPLVWMPAASGTLGALERKYVPTIMANTTKVCRDIDTINTWLQKNHNINQTAMLARLHPSATAKLFADDGYW